MFRSTTVRAACCWSRLCEDLPSTAEGAAVTPLDHEGAVGKQWARVSSLESRRSSSVPVDPEGKDCFYLDLLVCCRAVSKSALISRESRQQGSGPALPRPAQSQLRAELPCSPCPVHPSLTAPTSPLVISAAVTQLSMLSPVETLSY